MYKATWKIMPEYIKSVFSCCMSQGYFPRAWKSGRVAVYLTRQRGYEVLLAPIRHTLSSSSASKSIGEGNGAYNKFGFTKGRSTTNAKYVVAIFVDFKGALDFFLWNSVLTRLLPMSGY